SVCSFCSGRWWLHVSSRRVSLAVTACPHHYPLSLHDALPICDDPGLRGAPRGFTMTVRDVEVRAGAGFLVVLMGDIMTMPGLPAEPNALRIDVDEQGRVRGVV